LPEKNVVNFYSTNADVCQYMLKYVKFIRAQYDQLTTVSGHGFVNITVLAATH